MPRLALALGALGFLAFGVVLFVAPALLGVVDLDVRSAAARSDVRAVYGGTPGHPVVLGPRVLAAAGELAGDQGFRDLLSRFHVKRWEAGHLCSAVDVDTREELSRL